MERIEIKPRSNWEDKVSKLGLVYHHTQGQPYWFESAYYKFNSEQINIIEEAANNLHKLCMDAIPVILADNILLSALHIPFAAAELIRKSWDRQEFSIYGRFDLSYDGVHAPKLLEYNADTPTSLIEAAVAQWYWLEDVFPKLDQFNSIHEALVEKWKTLVQSRTLYFTCYEDNEHEDVLTTTYLQDTADQAGLQTKFIKINDIGWSGNVFLDNENMPIHNLFKLYPWEWLLNEEYGKYLINNYDSMFVIEPIWKMLLSNKGILPILWKLYPNHENLLPAYFDNPNNMKDYVKKPLLGREGRNIEIKLNGDILAHTDGDYGEEGYIYQQYTTAPNFNGNYPIIGAWIVDDTAVGMGIRESANMITDNLCRFVPHVFYEE